MTGNKTKTTTIREIELLVNRLLEKNEASYDSWIKNRISGGGDQSSRRVKTEQCEVQIEA